MASRTTKEAAEELKGQLEAQYQNRRFTARIEKGTRTMGGVMNTPWRIGAMDPYYGDDPENEVVPDAILDSQGEAVIYFADGLEDQPDLLRDAKHIVHCVNLHDELVATLRDMDEFIRDEVAERLDVVALHKAFAAARASDLS